MVLTQLEAANTALFTMIGGLIRGVFGLVTRTMAVGAVLLLLYVVAQPLLYASMYHESGIQTGIEAIELVEEGTNTAVQITNTAMDVVRPFQPVWNFVVYWLRRVATLQSRVMLIAIEELVNELVTSSGSSIAGFGAGCTKGEWKTFGGVSMGLCFQDLTSIEKFPTYSGRSKLVTDFASLVEGTHELSLIHI